MTNQKQILAVLTAVLCIGAPSVWALYMASMNITGTAFVTSGTVPEMTEYDIAVYLSNTTPQKYHYIYDNTNGNISFEFSIDTSGITSTDSKCVFEENKDIVFGILRETIWYNLSESESPTVTFASGVNHFDVVATGDENRCPSNGTISIQGILI